jgi:branched-chain amino acid transport system substrate-binding protein
MHRCIEEVLVAQEAGRRISRRGFAGGAAGIGAAALAGGRFGRTQAQESTPAAEAEDTVRVGIITSQSGPLQTYGEQYLEGLAIGLDYATGGTGIANGHRIEFEIRDDTGVPDVGVSAAIDLIGEGYTVLA